MNVDVFHSCHGYWSILHIIEIIDYILIILSSDESSVYKIVSYV